MSRINWKIVQTLLTIGAFLYGVPWAIADSRNYTKIVDQGSSIPNGTGNFSAFTVPQVNQGDIVFAGGGTGGQRGIYRFDPATGILSTIVDATTDLPKSPILTGPVLPTNINSIGVTVFGPDIGFIGNFAPSSTEVITTRGGLRQVIGSPASLPFGPGVPVSMDAQGFAFSNIQTFSVPGGPQTYTVYARVSDSGVLSLASSSSNVPHYIARDGLVGYYFNRRIAGTLGAYSLVTPSFQFDFSNGGGPPSAQPSSFLLPGQSSGTVFGGVGVLGAPIFSADDQRNVALVATAVDTSLNPLFSGIYTHPNGTGSVLQTVVDTNTLIPSFNGTTKFNSFGGVAIDGSVIVFIGGGNGTSGIFAASNGSLFEVISNGDTLSGKTISSLSFSGDRPLSGDQFVFSASFTDGSTGLYLAELPEPSAMTLLAIGSLSIFRYRRVSRRAEGR